MAYDNNDADTSLSAGLQTSREYRLKISLMVYFNQQFVLAHKVPSDLRAA